MNKKEIKELIETYEERHSGIHYCNGGYINVNNITIDKEKELVYADVELVFQMDGKTEKYTNLEYPFSMFKKEMKK